MDGGAVDAITTLDDLDCAGRRVLVRADLNLPMIGGAGQRRAAHRAAGADRRRAVRSARPGHRDQPPRPTRGQGGAGVVAAAGDRGPWPRSLAARWPLPATAWGRRPSGRWRRWAVARCCLLENLRFHPGEAADDAEFARALATLADAYVKRCLLLRRIGRTPRSMRSRGCCRAPPAADFRRNSTDSSRCSNGRRGPWPRWSAAPRWRASWRCWPTFRKRSTYWPSVAAWPTPSCMPSAWRSDVPCANARRRTSSGTSWIGAKRAECDIVLPTDAVVAAALAEGVESAVVAIKAVPADRLIVRRGAGHRRTPGAPTWPVPDLCLERALGGLRDPPVRRRHHRRRARRRRAAHARRGADYRGRWRRHGGGAAPRRGWWKISLTSRPPAAPFLEWLEGKELPGIAALKRA